MFLIRTTGQQDCVATSSLNISILAPVVAKLQPGSIVPVTWVVAGVCFYREYICTPSQTHKTRYADSCPAFTNFETKHNIFYQWPSQTQQKC